MIECSALWLDHEGAPCMLEAGHAGEHWTKVKLLYASGGKGNVEIIWASQEDLRIA